MDWADEDFCYVTTTGRRTGKPHEIEIWFVAEGRTAYLMSGGADASDWVRNMRRDPSVTVRIRDETLPAHARFDMDAEDEARIRGAMADKYAEREGDGSLSEWARTALPVALDLDSGSDRADGGGD